MNAQHCTSCDRHAFRELKDGECGCIEGYVEIMGECMDFTCQSVMKHCQTCGYDLNSKKMECLHCTGNRILTKQGCVCKLGFYTDGNGIC